MSAARIERLESLLETVQSRRGEPGVRFSALSGVGSESAKPEPVVAEPAAAEPTAAEPVAAKAAPVVAEPVASAAVAAKPEPVAAAPAASPEPAAEPVAAAPEPVAAPAVADPAAAKSEPTVAEPSVAEPVAAQSATAEPGAAKSEPAAAEVEPAIAEQAPATIAAPPAVAAPEAEKPEAATPKAKPEADGFAAVVLPDTATPADNELALGGATVAPAAGPATLPAAPEIFGSGVDATPLMPEAIAAAPLPKATVATTQGAVTDAAPTSFRELFERTLSLRPR